MAGEAQRSASRVAAVLALMALAATTSACSTAPEKKAGEGPNAELRRQALASLGENVVLPLYRDFEAATAELRSTANEYATSPSESSRSAARQAWIDAAVIWQQAELTQFGPAAMNSSVGGQELRARIYSWPQSNPCRIDQATLAEEYEDPAQLASQAMLIGLDAIEYLLFAESGENACAPNLVINTSGDWVALAEDTAELEQRRALHAAAVAGILDDDAAALRHAWDPAGDDFLVSFADAGRDGVYTTSQDALNAVGEALLYLDTETKDMKLAEPAGMMNCMTATCPEELESPWAHQDKSHVLNNLRGFQRLYLGGDPGGPEFGLDDLLAELGAGELSQTMSTEIDQAIAALDDMGAPTLLDALDTELASVQAVHGQVKEVTDLFKTQVTSVLDLERPGGAPADND